MLNPSKVEVPRPISSSTDEAPGRRRVQDARGLLHLDHERGLSAGDVVRRPDAREDAVHERDLGFAGRHERSGLRHDAQQRHLPEIGGLAPHVGSGQDDELAGPAIERHVVWHERTAGHDPPFDHRVAAVEDGQLVAVVDVRLDVVVDCGDLGQRGEDVQGGERPRGCLNPGRFAGDRAPQDVEDLELALHDPLVGPEHLLFVLLERGRDEALPAGNRLLAVIVGRHGVQVRLGDLDVSTRTRG